MGRSAKAADGFGVVTASARAFPALICGDASSPSANWKFTSPLITAIIDSPPPLYGTVVKLSPASCLNISAARWLVLPGTLIAALRTPGFALASAISSSADFAATPGCTISTSGVVLTQITGARSFVRIELQRASVERRVDRERRGSEEEGVTVGRGV